MRRDPFLNSIIIVVYRVAVWLFLAVIYALVLWYLVLQRGFGFDDGDTFRQLIRLVTGNADRTTLVIGVLTLSNAALLSGLLSIWLFSRWKQSGELQSRHIRGSRLGDDE